MLKVPHRTVGVAGEDRNSGVLIPLALVEVEASAGVDVDWHALRRVVFPPKAGGVPCRTL